MNSDIRMMNVEDQQDLKTFEQDEPPVRSSELFRCVEVSSQLKDNLTVMKRLIGDKWQESSKEYRVILLAVMAASGDTNPLGCAIPMAKEMSERGHSPLMLLAVATEMSEASDVERSDGAQKDSR
jgi:hypothetical protein